MKKKYLLWKLKKVNIVLLTLLSFIGLTGCPASDDDNPQVDPTIPTSNTTIITGWTGEDNVDAVPSSINFSFSNVNLPPKVDLTPFLPPIGNQGEHGTCVAWACAYYSKTSSEALIYNHDFSKLSSAAYQMSPKYLFVRIPDNKKGTNCNGTDFTSAFELLQEKGVATMSNVPYSNLSSCSNPSSLQNWDGEAGKHKIKYYRKIDSSISGIKQHLANKFPVIIGAKLSDSFIDWRLSQGPLNKNTTYDRVGLHSYHALTIVGYDDSRNAFRIVNSWGPTWGDNGYIWIDYNYLLTNFVSNNNIYIIASEENNPNPNPDPNPDPNPVNTGVDLAAWVFSDVSTTLQTGFPNTRTISFNIYNIGSQPANSNANWRFYYLYYNAYNANDYGIIFQDSFTNSAAPNTFNCLDANNCAFNYSINPGSSFAQTVFNQNLIPRGYSMPNLTGNYFLILVVDPENKFIEQNEQNNLFYTTSNLPKTFVNGQSNRVISGQKSKVLALRDFKNQFQMNKENLKVSNFNSAVNSDNRNAYTSEEIISFLKYKIKAGEFKSKIAEASNSTHYTGGYSK